MKLSEKKNTISEKNFHWMRLIADCRLDPAESLGLFICVRGN